MWVYSFPAVNHPQNQNNFLMFSSSTLHVQYSSVDHSLITVEFNIFPNSSSSLPVQLQKQMTLDKVFKIYVFFLPLVTYKNLKEKVVYLKQCRSL